MLLQLLTISGQAPDPVLDDPMGLAAMLTNAVKSHNWAMGAATLLMITVWLARKMRPTVDPKWLPLLGLVSAGFPALILALMRPQIDVGELVSGTLGIWLMANGAWSGVTAPIRDAVAARREPPQAPPAQADPAAPESKPEGGNK